jgi:hypothetical protein
LAGFIDGDGSLQIKIIKKKNRPKPEVRFQLQIELHITSKPILENILHYFGGNLGQNKNRPSCQYNSTSFRVFKAFIHYLDRRPLCSSKYKQYVI